MATKRPFTAPPGISIPSTGILNLTNILASTASTNGALIVAGGVGIGGSISLGGRLNLFNGLNFTAFQSSASGNTVYTLPATTPSTGSSVLQSDTVGNLSWVAMTATGGGGSGSGLSILNSLTDGVQFFDVGVGGSSFNISSVGSTHTFNIPIAGVASTGLITPNTQTISGTKTFTNPVLISNNTSSTTTGTGGLLVAGGLGVTGNASFGATIFLYNATLTNYTAFRSAATANTTYTFPATVPATGTSFLASSLNGVMTWQPPPFVSLNALTSTTQTFAVGSGGTGFNISSSGSIHTFNIPLASTGATGLVTGIAQTFGGNKTFAGGIVIQPQLSTVSGGTGFSTYATGDILAGTGTTLTRFPIGLDNYVLIADTTQSTDLRWGLVSNSSIQNPFIGIGSTTVGFGSTINLVAGAGISFGYTLNNITVYARSAVAVTSDFPLSPLQGDMYWNDNEGNLKIYYDDGQNEGQWVDASQRWGAGQYVTLPGLGAGTVYQLAYYAASGHTVVGDASFTNNTSSGTVSVNHTTGSGDTASGALVVAGGVGVGGTLYAQSVRSNSGFVENVYVGGTAGTGSTIYPNWAFGSVQTYTLAGNCWLGLPTNMPTGASLTLIISQNATGGWAMTSDSNIKYAGGNKTVSTGASVIDVINMFYTGSAYLAALTTGYS